MLHPTKIAAIALVLAVVSGCSANRKSIYHHNEIGDRASITTIDAKQRAILSNTKIDTVTHEDIRRFCSEPSPDVFSVVAQALSAGGTFGKSADPASIEAAFKVAFSNSEQGSSIPRTQTINMLRELMFRTCERYLNGAYDALEMSIQAIRDQRLMVSILAIEQITGPVSPKPVAIGASGSSTAGTGDVALVRLDDALKAKKAAEENHKKADEAFNVLNGSKVCDAITEAVKNDEDLTDEQKENQEKCDAARTALASAKTLLSEKTDHYADLKRLASTAGIATSTELTATTQGGIYRAHTSSVKDVVATVENIVAFNFDNDTEVMLFCLKVLPESLSFAADYSPSDLQKTCLSYIENQVVLESSRIRAKTQTLNEEIEESKARMDAPDRADFDRQWTKLQGMLSNATKATFVTALKDKLLPPEHKKADCFTDAESKDEYYICFTDLPAELRRNMPDEGVN